MTTQLWLIWSIEHRAWWGHNGSGYTLARENAGRYEWEEALENVRDANLHGGNVPSEALVPE